MGWVIVGNLMGFEFMFIKVGLVIKFIFGY